MSVDDSWVKGPKLALTFIYYWKFWTRHWWIVDADGNECQEWWPNLHLEAIFTQKHHCDTINVLSVGVVLYIFVCTWYTATSLPKLDVLCGPKICGRPFVLMHVIAIGCALWKEALLTWHGLLIAFAWSRACQKDLTCVTNLGQGVLCLSFGCMAHYGEIHPRLADQ